MTENPKTAREEVVDPQPGEDIQAPAASEHAADEPTAQVEAEAAETDWQDLALRKAAEVENLRKQGAQRVQKATRDGMRRVVGELLPALDDFERALAHAEAEESGHPPPEAVGRKEHHLTHGIRLVQQQMLSALQRVGIEAYSPKGERFDPHLHEAVATAPVDGVESGVVVDVYQAGYRFGDEVLRAAKVVVAA